MPWRMLKYWREILEFFEVASERFAKITAVAILLFLIMGAGIVFLYIDRKNQIVNYERRLVVKDSIIFAKDFKIEELNLKLQLAPSQAIKNYMEDFERGLSTMSKLMDEREKSQDRQLMELKKIKK